MPILAAMSAEQHKRDRIQSYAEAYLGDYGFEKVMVESRQRLVLELIRELRPNRVLEAGCGADLLCEKAVAQGASFSRWMAIEPSPAFAAAARGYARKEPRFDLCEGFFEEKALSLRVEGGFDLVIVAGLLGELPDPGAVLRAAREVCASEGIVHINVPNALSLHRRLARAMSLIKDEHEMSARNQLLQQHRVYDAVSLREDIEAAGLQPVDTGGYMLKPFTHAQMEDVTRLLGEGILPGLWEMGRELPELASEIYINARPRG